MKTKIAFYVIANEDEMILRLRHLAVLGLVMALGAACGDATINLPERFAVLSIYPSMGAINVPHDDVLIEVSFNDVIDRSTLAADSIKLTWEQQDISIANVVSYSGKTLLMVPQNILAPDSEYTMTLDANLAGEELGPLFEAYRTRFRTAP